MGTRIFSLRKSLFAALLLISLASLGLAACGKAPSETSTPANASSNQSNLAGIQKNGYLVARLYGLVTFDFGGQDVTWPTEMKIASVPLTWMGTVFTGKLEITTDDASLVDEVHGSVASDGESISSFSFSRKIIRPRDAVGYYVTLKNLPLGNKAASKPTPFSFEATGDIQKYVQEIAYGAGGTLQAGTVPQTTYKSMDWTNTTQGGKPSLKVAFEVEPSEVIGTTMPPPPGGIPM